MLARDASNFSGNFTAERVHAWRDSGVGLILIQAFPVAYKQYAIQQQQQGVCVAMGMPWGSYIYDYLADPTWLSSCLAGLVGDLPRKLYLDEEDISLVPNNWPVAARVSTVQDSLLTADQWCSDHGLPRAAIYSAAWWWVPKLGNTSQFSDRELWAAQYDGVPDASVFTPFGGWQSCRIKQFAGSQPDGTDLNALSAEEEAELTQPDPTPAPDCSEVTAQRDGLTQSLGYLAGDCLAPVAKLKFSAQPKAVQNLIANLRAQADQHGISHA